MSVVVFAVVFGVVDALVVVVGSGGGDGVSKFTETMPNETISMLIFGAWAGFCV